MQPYTVLENKIHVTGLREEMKSLKVDISRHAQGMESLSNDMSALKNSIMNLVVIKKCPDNDPNCWQSKEVYATD
jgi:hypothetical protein